MESAGLLIVIILAAYLLTRPRKPSTYQIPIDNVSLPPESDVRNFLNRLAENPSVNEEIDKEAMNNGIYPITPNLVRAVIWKESSGVLDPPRGDGGTAHGIMQVRQLAKIEVDDEMKKLVNWKWFPARTMSDLDHWPHSLRYGVRYLALRLKEHNSPTGRYFVNDERQAYRLAIAAYNEGPISTGTPNAQGQMYLDAVWSRWAGIEAYNRKYGL